jgi:xylan 1,4-beta-xylosidase
LEGSALDVMQNDVIQNPVLRGFEPDPSILRVGDDYYLATSTCLSYADGLFHVLYTVVDSYAEGWKDIPNYLVTAPSIDGPWSAPVVLHGRGWDVSLFHDADGRSWLLNMVFDWRPDRPGFAGIEIQEYSRSSRRLLGRPRLIFAGTSAGVTEGPHLYRRGAWYYLVVAEGGTGVEHQVTVARSRELFGPYEPDPAGPLMTAKHDRGLTLQKAGHGCFVETQAGEWYMAHLTARPYQPSGRSVLGRETAIQRIVWGGDGWPRLDRDGGVGVPAAEVRGPGLTADPTAGGGANGAASGHDFEADWSTLRRGMTPDWIVVDSAAGDAVVTGGQSPMGRRAPSLLAHRVTAERCSLSARVTFPATSGDHLAGIAGYYNSRNWHYQYVTAEDDGSLIVRALSCVAGKLVAHDERLAVEPSAAVNMRAEFDGAVLRFSPLDLALDATILSDEHADEFHDGVVRAFGFTGAMVGLWVIDLAGEAAQPRARFSAIEYRVTGDRE